MPGKTVKQVAKRLLEALRRARRPAAAMQFGSGVPLSRLYGFDRGTPIDRIYIEAFLARHSADIRGSVLEVTDDRYSKQFGGGRISRQDVLHRDRDNDRATLHGDLGSPATLPDERFDCVILTQTLQYVPDLSAALANLRRSLRPGGALLLTVPAVGPVQPSKWGDDHLWLFTAAGLSALLAKAFGEQRFEVETLGNLYAATAFLHGAAAEDVERNRLEPAQAEYAVIIAARAINR